jgi:hypothetical protein
MAKFSSCQNTSEKINHFVRDGCVGRAAAACLSKTGSFDAKKEFRVVNVMAAHEIKKHAEQHGQGATAACRQETGCQGQTRARPAGSEETRAALRR